jgi:hypothetical protein
MPDALPRAPLASARVPTILLVEHDLNEAWFVHSLIFEVLKADVWLWHEERLDPALRLLSVMQFSLIMLDLDLPRLSARTAVRRVRRVARHTPLMVRMRPEKFRPELNPKVYQADAVAPKGIGAPIERIIRRLLSGGA